ncbi:MAG: PEP-CTERM sorting domain-containing protein [bacterium]
MNSMNKRLIILAFGFMLLLNIPSAQATMLDLTTIDADGWIGDAYFLQINPQSTGTGVIDSFVEIGDARQSTDEFDVAYADVVEAYNTTVNGTFDNGSSDNFNHELLFSLVPSVELDDGEFYRQFLLDVNQNSGLGDTARYISLDEIQVFLSSDPNQDVESFDGDGIVELEDSELLYWMDEEEDSWVKLDYELNAGSGSGDMFLYLPEELFEEFYGDDPDNEEFQYVYIYSRFGENFTNNDGFEEWAVQKDIVPEPTTISLLGLGLLGLVGSRKRKRS